MSPPVSMSTVSWSSRIIYLPACIRIFWCKEFYMISFLFFLSVFEQYQKARTQFVQTIAELSTRPQNIETLQNAGNFNYSIKYFPISFLKKLGWFFNGPLSRRANFSEKMRLLQRGWQKLFQIRCFFPRAIKI